MAKLLKYWERNGTRRPFPSVWEARQKYGDEAVSYFPPRFEKENRCPWCGGEVNNKRRRFCSKECAQNFADVTTWHRGRGAYSLKMIYRDNFTCQDCGEFHAFINSHGMIIPIDDGKLEVHHILPVSVGGGDEPQNLITLCKSCHKKRHDEMKGDAENGRKET